MTFKKHTLTLIINWHGINIKFWLIDMKFPKAVHKIYRNVPEEKSHKIYINVPDAKSH